MNSVRLPSGPVAIFALTKGGLRLALKLKAHWADSLLYLPGRLQDRASANPDTIYFESFRAAFAGAFKTHPAIICIMAAGIVVRSLNGLTASKFSDPAVVVVDEKGTYAISLLSGHLGGANRLSLEVAKCLGGQAVITTATDVNGCLAIDLLAQRINALIRPTQNIKTINRCLAEGEQVNIYSPWPLRTGLLQGLRPCTWPYKGPLPNRGCSKNMFKGPAVVLAAQRPMAGVGADILFLNPRNLSLGVGCRRGVDYKQLYQGVGCVLDGFGIDTRCLSNLASVDIKREEPALKELANYLNLPFLTYSKGDIEGLDGTYIPSELVKRKIGVGGVCEPAARLAAQTGITIVAKQIIGAVTISVAMEKSWWWDWDQVGQNP